MDRTELLQVGPISIARYGDGGGIHIRPLSYGGGTCKRWALDVGRYRVRFEGEDIADHIKLTVFPTLERGLRFVQNSFNGPMESVLDKVSICTACAGRRSGTACHGKGKYGVRS
jgi:hypothetical protein